MIYSLLISNKLLGYDPIIKKRKLFELIFLKEFCIIKWRCYNWKTFCFSCHIKIIELLKARTRKSRDKNFYLELRWVLSIMRTFIILCWELVYNYIENIMGNCISTKWILRQFLYLNRIEMFMEFVSAA